MVTVLHESAWPKDAADERAGAPYVVVLGDAAAEVSRHATPDEALGAARVQGPGAAVWRAGNLAELGEGGPLAEVVED